MRSMSPQRRPLAEVGGAHEHADVLVQFARDADYLLGSAKA